MRQKALWILILLLFAVGIAILLYPLASEWYNSRSQATIIENYGNALQELDEETCTALREAAQEYNAGLQGKVFLTDPFDERTLDESSEEYQSLLNIAGDGVMGYVRVPKIDVRLPIYHGTSPDVLKMGAGHLVNTSLPIGGICTHAVISAHTGLPTATLFTDLDQLEKGDLFFMEVLGETLAYRIDQIKVVEPEDTSDLLIDSEKDYVTLVTCTPYGINSHRLLVRGERTEYTEALEEEAVQVEPRIWNWPYIIAGAVFALLIIFLVILYAVFRRRRKNWPFDS